MRDKTKNDPLGSQLNCQNFDQCPFCYGCRNYNTRDIECEECAKNPKVNLCKTELHKPDLIGKMVTRTRITI